MPAFASTGGATRPGAHVSHTPERAALAGRSPAPRPHIGAGAVPSGRALALPPPAALPWADSNDASARPAPRGGAAGPLRVLSPLREAGAAAEKRAALASTLQHMTAASAAGGAGRPGAGGKVSLKLVSAPVDADMEVCRRNLVDVVGRRHPLLRAAADQIFSAGGKRLRPLIVLLVARATLPLSGLPDLADRHRRLAEITEMIHTASLVHDDVLDESDLRRGAATVNAAYGTRVAVLVGDFLFAQSSWFLANLDNLEVIKLISQVIADFADGEISQAASLFDVDTTMEAYLDKSFYKTASLVAASARGAAVFSDADEEVKAAMYEYGRRLGLAFQVVDDVLDFTQSAAALGKPPGQDLASGNLTAPALFALADAAAGPRLRALLKGKLRGEGALDEALALVDQAGGVAAARALAREQGDLALAALGPLPPTPARDALAAMVDYVLERLY
jgi:all-trans-nonaprenyl-diphosphate synthase